MNHSLSLIQKSDQLEAAVRTLTQPINGQYPRPWMTSLTSPASARLFTVGKNQRNGFDIGAVGSHARYLDALFNRGSETCRQLYDRLTDKPSPTRRHTDDLVAMLGRNGVTDVLETNVICYSTPMSADLKKPLNAGGANQGREIFETLFRLIKPRVIIAHGSDTAKELGRVLGCTLPKPPEKPGDPVKVMADGTTVFVIPSLAPPAYNRWSSWSAEHLEQVCRQAADAMQGP
ncbi:hypothetical protein HNQ71_004560 [Mesorhizobium sangaii]|uniref:Uracil-DNA glycosylase-like domain-containing protein n=1 Tax=Mesorhizobium sangaii TaxID=505389 RepID=A0A841PNY6_9HYPH|nr:hypothetical protein [Mesorhizobium sangaii]